MNMLVPTAKAVIELGKTLDDCIVSSYDLEQMIDIVPGLEKNLSLLKDFFSRSNGVSEIVTNFRTSGNIKVAEDKIVDKIKAGKYITPDEKHILITMAASQLTVCTPTNIRNKIRALYGLNISEQFIKNIRKD